MSELNEYLNDHGMPKSAISNLVGTKYDNFGSEMILRRIDGSSMGPGSNYIMAKNNTRLWKHLGYTGKTVLDVGCGMGYFLKLGKEIGINTVGLNISPYEASLARHGKINEETKVMDWKGDSSSEVALGSIFDIPLEEESVDGINCVGMFMMLPFSDRKLGSDRGAMLSCWDGLKEMKRVLKKGGELYLVTFSDHMEPSERTENYIFFGEDNYFVVDKTGHRYEEGPLGIDDFLEDAGFSDIRKVSALDKNSIVIKRMAKKL